MKTIVQTIICAALLVLPHYGFSQSGYTQATEMDVKGVFIGGTYTKTQVETKNGGLRQNTGAERRSLD